MMSKSKQSLALLLRLALLSAILPQVLLPVHADIPKPLIPLSRDFTLSNGLRVLLSVDHSVPVAALAVVYDVGARDERKGRSGFAHFFEHMMFQGSENVAKGEHSKFIESAGGTTNASTHPDFTNYFDKVPSNQIELCLWLESDRMRSLKVTAQNFQNQLQTVKEEKRSRIDNQPYVPASLRLEEKLFDNWSNAHPVIGSFEDLDASSLEDIKDFFKTYYAPNNAVMAVVGDFDADEMQKLVQKYFASIPAAPRPPRPNVHEADQTSPREEPVEDRHAVLPFFWLGFKTPARRDPDFYPLLIAQKLLSQGESSRLYQRLVKGEKVAISVETGYEERRGPGAFEAFILYKPEYSPEKVKEIFWSEIENLKTNAVKAEELEKARNQILRNYFAGTSYSSLQRSLGRAELLAEYALFYGDPACLDEDIQALMKVGPDDIKRVAEKYFRKDAVTIIDGKPAGKGESAKL